MTESQELLSVFEIAKRLKLHVRTVRNYVREGRLKGVRIGKQYRIARADLESLTGRALAAPSAANDVSRRHTEVSSIIQVEAIDFEAASRVTNALMAAVKGRAED